MLHIILLSLAWSWLPRNRPRWMWSPHPHCMLAWSSEQQLSRGLNSSLLPWGHCSWSIWSLLLNTAGIWGTYYTYEYSTVEGRPMGEMMILSKDLLKEGTSGIGGEGCPLMATKQTVALWGNPLGNGILELLEYINPIFFCKTQQQFGSRMSGGLSHLHHQMILLHVKVLVSVVDYN